MKADGGWVRARAVKAQLQVGSQSPPCKSPGCNPEEDAHGGES